MLRCISAAVLACGIVAQASSLQGAYVLLASHRVVHRGDDRHINVVLVGGSQPVQGYSFGISHDPAVASLLSIEPGISVDAATGGSGPEFSSVDIDPAGGSGGTIEVVLSSIGDVVFVPWWPKHVARLHYDIATDAPTGPSPLEFTSTLGEPEVAVELQLADGSGTEVSPFAIDGKFIVLPGGGEPDPDGAGVLGQLWFLNGGDDTITVIGPDGETLESIDVAEQNPVAVASDPSGFTWVAYRDSNTVVRFTDSGDVASVVLVDDQPVSLALDSNGDAWVGCAGDGVLDKIAADGQVLLGGDGTGSVAGILGPAVPIGGAPSDVAVDSFDNVYVTCTAADTITKVSSTGGTISTENLPMFSEPWSVAIDRDGYLWLTLHGTDQVQRRASDLSLVETFELLTGARPAGITLRTGTEAWTYGSLDGNLYRLRAGETAAHFPGTGQPSGIAADVLGFLWVTDRDLDEVLRFDGEGTWVESISIGPDPGFLGDASGLVRLNTFFPDEDFDGDTFSSGLEIDFGTNPLDADAVPTEIPGFVAPVTSLACDLNVQSVSLSWSIAASTPYDSLVVRRDDAIVATLPGDAEGFVDPDPVAIGIHHYDVTGQSGAAESPPTSCTIVVGQGAVLGSATIELDGVPVDVFGMTVRPNPPPGEPTFYFTDPGEGRIYGADAEFHVLTVLPSPFSPAGSGALFARPGTLSSEPMAGIAFRSSGDGGSGSLFVAAGSTGDPLQPATIREITLAGDPIGDPITLKVQDPVDGLVQIRGGLAGLSYHKESGILMSVGPDLCELYSIIAPIGGGIAGSAGDGEPLPVGTILPSASATHPVGGPALNGVYFPPYFDFGSDGGRVHVSSVSSDGEFQLSQLAIAGGEASVVGQPVPLAAADAENSFGGFVIEGDTVVAVGLTTATVYELGSAFFVRGDVSDDGSLDLGDAIRILEACFGLDAFTSCVDAFDVDDNGNLDLADPILMLEYLFSDGTPPFAPYPATGPDPTPDEVPCL